MSEKKTDYQLYVEEHIWTVTHKLMEALYHDVITAAMEQFPKVSKEYITKSVEEAVEESLDWD